jgi:hypothetical protein
MQVTPAGSSGGVSSFSTGLKRESSIGSASGKGGNVDQELSDSGSKDVDESGSNALLPTADSAK